MRIGHDIYLAGSGKLGFDWTHPADCNVYLIDTGEGLVLVDSGTGLSVSEIERNIAAHGFRLERIAYVLLTHLHADHSGGAAEIRRRSGARVAVPAGAADALEGGDEHAIDLPRARSAGFYPADYRWEACPADILLTDGDSLDVGRYAFRALHTPGHSRHDTCFYMERAGGGAPVLISGDTVMYGGRISMLNTSDFSMGDLARSIERLAGLEPELLLPGHGQPALSRAAEHVRAAHHIFDKLGIPANIG
ncbi:MBL fold metallo-hydrolase [uncultured Paenibacillus sp.]|uniref:MBL fold metallo-hydrolase n=1 Tax=uncultured Paenibacillus sp. TaxID=227322 RepID=UPI0028D541B2|nr:MBL fold metallo-hydrolase [uncultured Paenibacillus sp.]